MSEDINKYKESKVIFGPIDIVPNRIQVLHLQFDGENVFLLALPPAHLKFKRVKNILLFEL